MKRNTHAQNKTDNNDDDEHVSLGRRAGAPTKIDGIIAESDRLRFFIEACKNQMWGTRSEMGDVLSV
jgi:hypothetical protein